MEDITIIYTYYGQKERIEGILREKHPQTRVIIVDDGTPEPLKAPRSIEIIRIPIDVPWNQPAARNRGFREAKGWIVCADIDHLVTKENVEDILKLNKEKGTVYFLGREDTNSWNIFLIHKEDFDKIGGYDEQFCGHYGYDDIDFLLKCQDKLIVKEARDIKAKVFAKESSSKGDRDTDFNRRLLEKKYAH